MNISHLITTPNIYLDTNAFIEELRYAWIGKEFNYIFDDFIENSNGTYTVLSRNYLHDNVSFNPEPVKLNCSKEQNIVMSAFDTLKNLSL